MTTLGQKFDKLMEGFQGCFFEEIPLYYTEYFLKEVIEHLTEKRKEKHFTGERLSGSTELSHNIGQIQMLDELIKEFIEELP